ncbi:MAG: hypothetical protein LBQ94_02045 [Treponema sp.]|jgi:D-alanine-D-alanine ligase-like ATP-grasp enzyme|nr:hypothetical protein [Treponema sp.]
MARWFSEKLKVDILFGGKSAEHEVSLQSAKKVTHGACHQFYMVYLL